MCPHKNDPGRSPKAKVESANLGQSMDAGPFGKEKIGPEQ